jgi:hypothetical protein
MCDGKIMEGGVSAIVLSHNILRVSVTQHKGMQLKETNPAEEGKNLRKI